MGKAIYQAIYVAVEATLGLTGERTVEHQIIAGWWGEVEEEMRGGF